MSLSSHFTAADQSAGSSDFVVSPEATSANSVRKQGAKFADRRNTASHETRRSNLQSRERRQFGSTHAELSEDGRELATAIDRYKLEHHRRYITCDEMLHVLHELGYERVTELK